MSWISWNLFYIALSPLFWERISTMRWTRLLLQWPDKCFVVCWRWGISCLFFPISFTKGNKGTFVTTCQNWSVLGPSGTCIIFAVCSPSRKMGGSLVLHLLAVVFGSSLDLKRVWSSLDRSRIILLYNIWLKCIWSWKLKRLFW